MVKTYGQKGGVKRWTSEGKFKENRKTREEMREEDGLWICKSFIKETRERG